jgi:hypothetical protein
LGLIAGLGRSGTPPGCDLFVFGREPGVSLALDPRLLSGNPAGLAELSGGFLDTSICNVTASIRSFGSASGERRRHMRVMLHEGGLLPVNREIQARINKRCCAGSGFQPLDIHGAWNLGRRPKLI